MVLLSKEYNEIIAVSEATFESPTFPSLDEIADYAEKHLQSTYEDVLTFNHQGKTLRPTFLVNAKVMSQNVYATVSVNEREVLRGVHLCKCRSVRDLADFVVGDMIKIRLDRVMHGYNGEIKEAIAQAYELDWQMDIEEIEQTVKFDRVNDIGGVFFKISLAGMENSIDLAVAVDESLEAQNIEQGGEWSKLSGLVYKQNQDIFVELFNNDTHLNIVAFLLRVPMYRHFDKDQVLESISNRIGEIIQSNIWEIRNAVNEQKEMELQHSAEELDFKYDIINYRLG